MSRNRNRYESIDSTSTESFWVEKSTGNILFHNVGTYPDGYKNETCEDTVTPGWKQKILQGEIVNNYFRYQKNEQYYPDGSSVESSAHYEIHRYGSGANVTSNLLDRSDLSYDKWFDTSGCIADIDSTPFEMGEDVLEIRETLKFLRDPLKSMKDLSRSFSKRRRKLQSRGLSRDKALANAWLQYRFALMPLVLSAENILQGLQADYKFPERRISRSTVSSYDNTEASETDRDGWVSTTYVSGQWKGRCGVCYSVSNPANYWRSVFGLRTKDVPVALWAIVPYSFMIDRMINISDMIKGLLNLSDPNVTIHYGWKTGNDEFTRKTLVTDKVSTDRSPSTAVCSNGGFMQLDVDHERTPWVPTYSDTIPKPDWGGLVSSVNRTLDLIAIIVQQFR